MIKKIQAARGKLAAKAPPKAPATSEPQWATEPEPTEEEDHLRSERDERQKRLDVLNRLITG